MQHCVGLGSPRGWLQRWVGLPCGAEREVTSAEGFLEATQQESGVVGLAQVSGALKGFLCAACC